MKTGMKSAMKTAMKSAMKTGMKSAMKSGMKSAMKSGMKSAMKMKKMSMKKDGPKRPMNEYFQLMTEAKKTGAPSFVYKGTTYVKVTTEKGLVTYKKK